MLFEAVEVRFMTFHDIFIQKDSSMGNIVKKTAFYDSIGSSINSTVV